MFLVGLISWWYGRGWLTHLYRVGARFNATLDFFSIGQLTKTLFAPFRQISAGASGDASFGGAVRAFVDQLISRVIGGFVRFFTILLGVVVIIFQAVYETIALIAWWLVPLFPIVGFILLAVGWVPVWK